MSIVGIILTFVFIGIVIGYLGRKYRFGFWGYFFMSVLLTPVVGLLALIAAIPKDDDPRRGARR